ncbi:MAG: tRNA (guanosine(37)-N1)-methyltransferase TrmD [Dehalococcoidia bacterium]|nr:tRNA (guanosine(37)-N1)-methyltransferase TrmD [Dehalococcoidia bacterium]
MRIDVLTLFPDIFAGPFAASVLGRARERGIVDLHTHDIRSFTSDRHHVVDDYPYGGGAGMVMKPEPLFAAVEGVRGQADPAGRCVLLSPQGRPFTQDMAVELAREPRLLLVCGHYEGFDERAREHLADDEISIGDFVLSGGEPAAWVIVDAVVRLLPGTLGSEQSLVDESFTDGLLEYPHYTRPPEFRGWGVPEVLLSGHHGEIEKWRRRQRIIRTAQRRPDLLGKVELTAEEQRLAQGIIAGQEPPG